jgi:hypothetical protein
METRPLIIKPILLYAEYKKVEGSSWRNWGGIQSRKDAESELLRIRDELNKFMEHLDFPVKILSADMVSELKELEGIRINTPSHYSNHRVLLNKPIVE